MTRPAVERPVILNVHYSIGGGAGKREVLTGDVLKMADNRSQGDRDTTCAIVGGIVALSAGEVPQSWMAQREPLPDDLAV